MSLLGAIGSIAGGLLGKSKTIDPRESVTLHTRGIRQASEWYGFNPLTLLQNVAPSSTVTGPNPMGSAIADAAMFAADAFLQKGNQQALLVNEYQRQNKELQDRLTRVTLQPKVPGVYGGGDGGLVPASANMGQSADRPERSGRAGLGQTFGSPLAVDRDWMTPDRETTTKPTENISGLMHVDNAITGPLTFFGADGEIFMEYLQAPIVGAPQVANNWYKKMGLPPLDGANWVRGVKLAYGAGREKPKRPKKRPAFFDLPDPNSAFSPRMKFPWE